MPSRVLAPLLLAVFLLFAEQGGFTHALSHFGGSAPAEKHAPPGHCDQCVAYCGVSTAHGLRPAWNLPKAGADGWPASAFASWQAAPSLAFFSRGPPPRT